GHYRLRIPFHVYKETAYMKGAGKPSALEPVQNLEFWRCKRQNSTLQAPKEPENRDICGLLTANIHNLNRLL
ncbi:MAG: hypothetical protein LBD08_01255, partial [Treponema sp.]|nr:hypothetical protein [Treponema sp.]